ncbi:macrolide family glycosyltransferase [Amycolatopsis minnesotensis]|uniref:Erythromycin biosynthesis protein CIII-like C-terminal domain-containing protein n=1 Tax=Amycolatopsis minnesotensis TaxID=337894 RepID=A0ABN2QK87_9PSEU
MRSEPSQAQHVLFLPYPSPGHVIPTKAIARELMRRGHRVTYAVTADVAELAAETGAGVIDYRVPLMSETHPPDTWTQDALGAAFLQYITELTGTTTAIEAQAGADRPDLIVYDCTVWAPGRALGRKWKIPTVQLVPVFASNERYSLMRAQVDGADHPQLDEDHPAIAKFHEMMAEFMASHGLDPAEATEFREAFDEHSLVFHPRALQPYGDTFGPETAFVGLSHEDGDDGKESTDRWQPPGDGKPVLFISLGTVVNDRPDFFLTCAEAFNDSEWHVVLAVDEALDDENGEMDLSAFADNFEVHSWIPYHEVMPHAEVFVSQAGMGGMMHAGNNSVPIVVVPHQPEQRVSAARVVELGLGPRLDPDASAEELRAAVHLARTDPGIRRRTKWMKCEIDAAGGAPRAAELIVDLLRDPGDGDPGPYDAVDLPRTRGCPFDPPDRYRELAETGPLHRMRFPLGDDGWLVTGFDEAKTVLTDPRFSHRSELIDSPLPPPFPFPPGRHRAPAAEPGAFNRMDTPQHTRYRRLVAELFSARRAEEQIPAIEAACTGLLDGLAERGGPADLVRDFARPLPAKVIFDLLGVPADLRAPLHDNLDVLMHLQLDVDDLLGAVKVVGDLLDELVAGKRTGGDGDLLSELASTSDLDDTELRNLTWALLGGGTDTTANMISLGTLALLEHPDQLAALRAAANEPAAPGGRPPLDLAIDELLRYLTISQFGASRAALADVEVGGKTVREGETVLVALPAVNRDPGRFPDADRLDVTREHRANLAFGHGVHKCVGQFLAKATLRVAYPALFERFPGLRAAVPLDQVPLRHDMDHYGVHELKVTW